MNEINYHTIGLGDDEKIAIIADWYAREWNIPVQTTIQKLNSISTDPLQFQILMTHGDIPIATGGLYNRVGLVEREPKYAVYKNWLALVYTKPENRNKGYGALICEHIQKLAKDIGLKEIYLFTHTAENLYRRLGWREVKRLASGGKNTVIMKKSLNPEPHPFKWYIPDNAKSLIVGTFPPVKSRWAFDFFYPNPRNLFWKIMSEIAGKPISNDLSNAIDERRSILDQLQVGITDMGGVINRLADNSFDENLDLIEHMPIFQILEDNPAINRIILTSSSGKVSALAWFKTYLIKHGVDHLIPKGSKPLHFIIRYKDKNIDVYVLYSPSPRAANRITAGQLTNMYRKALTN